MQAAKELGINTIKVEEGDAHQALDHLSGLLGFPLNEYVPGTKAVRSALRSASPKISNMPDFKQIYVLMCCMKAFIAFQKRHSADV